MSDADHPLAHKGGLGANGAGSGWSGAGSRR